MNVFNKIAGIITARDMAQRPLGLVPTMGYLHAGHLALVQQAMHENRTVVVSIFVNPTQFGPTEDLTTYPRDMERDLELLREEGVQLVFAPSEEEMYPQGFATYLDVQGVSAHLEGKRRPGHFNGVATVVTKLLTIVRPHRTYFGQKDGQQAVVVKRLNQDLNLGSEIVVVPTVRAPDGLALSSRNVYLTEEERHAAPVFYFSLSRVKELWQQGQQDAEILRQELVRLIATEPLVQLDYVSIADSSNLEELAWVNRPAMVSLAARLGNTRLIDNIILGDTQ